jgi:hypothetical protein
VIPRCVPRFCTFLSATPISLPEDCSSRHSATASSLAGSVAGPILPRFAVSDVVASIECRRMRLPASSQSMPSAVIEPHTLSQTIDCATLYVCKHVLCIASRPSQALQCTAPLATNSQARKAYAELTPPFQTSAVMLSTVAVAS